jgi:hypothetical protein
MQPGTRQRPLPGVEIDEAALFRKRGLRYVAVFWAALSQGNLLDRASTYHPRSVTTSEFASGLLDAERCSANDLSDLHLQRGMAVATAARTARDQRHAGRVRLLRCSRRGRIEELVDRPGEKFRGLHGRIVAGLQHFKARS